MSVADKKLAKKVKLVDAAYELFIKKGVNITAIDDVVKLAGVAKGTFYLYFRDKYDLLDQIVISKSENLIQKALENLNEKRSSRVMSASEQIIYFADYLVDYLVSHSDLAALIQKNLSACHRLLITDEETKLKRELT